MKCVIDTSSVSWLGRVGMLNLLPMLYDTIYASAGVLKQLEGHRQTKEFVGSKLEKIVLNKKDQKRFDKLTRRRAKKFNWQDPVDIESIIAYKFFLQSDEVLFANKGAKKEFSSFAKIRDITDLYLLAEQKRIWSRTDSLKYLNLLRMEGYRPDYLQEMILSLTV